MADKENIGETGYLEGLDIWRDWKSFLADKFQHIPQITSYHRFCFDSQHPGFVFLKEFSNSTEERVKIVNTGTILNSTHLPEEIHPAGMDIKRRWYLYEEI